MAQTVRDASHFALRLLRQTLTKKLQANIVRFTTDSKGSEQFFNEAVEHLSIELAKAVRRSGLIPEEHGSVNIGPTDFLRDATTIAVKIGAIWSDKPADLIVFCVQKMEDARESEKQARLSQGETEDRLHRLLERLAAAKDMDGVRDAIRSEESE